MISAFSSYFDTLPAPTGLSACIQDAENYRACTAPKTVAITRIRQEHIATYTLPK